MAAGAWVVYNEFKLALGKKIVNLSATDSIKMALFQSTSNAGSASLVTAQYATLTNQVASANVYTTGGVVCAQTYTDASGTETFNVANATWTASGGSIVARFAVLYDDTATNKDLICYCLLDSTPADVTVTTGNQLSVVINASGVFTLA
jgi:hypothetical protein